MKGSLAGLGTGSRASLVIIQPAANARGPLLSAKVRACPSTPQRTA